MEINTRVENEIYIVDIVGNLDTNTAPDADNQLTELMDQGVKKIVINFDKLDFITSAGLRVFLAASKRIKSEEGDIRICNLNETVQEVFDISGFSTILNVFGSLEQSLENI
jgi:anti-sigma B factor antagonist